MKILSLLLLLNFPVQQDSLTTEPELRDSEAEKTEQKISETDYYQLLYESEKNLTKNLFR